MLSPEACWVISSTSFPPILVGVASFEVGGACLESLDLSKYFTIPSVFSLAFSTILPFLVSESKINKSNWQISKNYSTLCPLYGKADMI